jgi:hypothetical protein
METNTFYRPLVPGLVEQQCDHNSFCHRVLPVLINEDGALFLEEIQRTPRSAYDFFSWAFCATNEHTPLELDRDILLLSDIEVTTKPLPNGNLIIITLSPPTQEIGTFLIGLLQQGTNIRYFTLENSYGGSTRLCEWTNGTQHRNLGVGSSPTIEAFYERIGQYLTIGF